MDALGRRIVHFAVANAAAGGHRLQFAGAKVAVAAGAVAVVERALQHPRENFHVVVAMFAETRRGFDDVVVDHAQRAVAQIVRVVIAAKRKRVPAVQPT